MAKQWVTIDKLAKPGESESDLCERLGREFAGKIGRYLGLDKPTDGRILGPFRSYKGNFEGLCLEGKGWGGVDTLPDFPIKKHGTWAWITPNLLAVECEVLTQPIYKPCPASAPEEQKKCSVVAKISVDDVVTANIVNSFTSAKTDVKETADGGLVVTLTLKR